MLHVTRAELENYGPFFGKHAIDLGPHVYAVTASREADAESSNWVGKSWFLSIVPFVLLGWHMADNEDGFINDNAKSAAGRLVLSDGTKIERARKKTTQLKVTLPGAGEAKGMAAQVALLKHLGIAHQRDYFATSFFEQKKISQLVTMGATDRQELIRGWLDLEAIEACEQLAWDEAKEAEDAQRLILDREKYAAAFWDRIDDEVFPGVMRGPGETTRADLVALLVTLDANVAAAELEVQRASSEHSHTLQVDAAQRFKAIEAEGVQLRAEYDQMQVATDAEIAAADLKAKELAGKHAALSQDHERALQAANCHFDGKCPVAGIDCPAKDSINAGVDQAIAHADRLTDEVNALIMPLHEAQLAADGLRQMKQSRALVHVRLESLRQQARKAQEGYQGSADALIAGVAQPGQQTPAERLRQAKDGHTKAVEAASVIRRAIAEGDRLEAARAGEAERSAAQRRLTAARMTAKIYRKAQRAVAQRNMAEVEVEANAGLAAVGADLKVQLAWAREGGSLASACGECGGAFPKSLKAKECDRCGAPRGPSEIERLDVALSDWSGAAEDLAGVAVQLAAAGWLRSRKAMRWASASVDEPFGALDAVLRRALTGQLKQLLGRAGFAQAFVVAHDRAIMGSLAHRVELVRGREGTRIDGG